MSNDQVWLTVYLSTNAVFALGCALLMRLARRVGAPPDAERASEASHLAVSCSIVGMLFGGKFLWAMLSGKNLITTRKSLFSEWVTRESDYIEFITQSVCDAGVTLVCVVCAFCFRFIRNIALRSDLDALRKKTLVAQLLMVMFWTFILTIEGIVYWRYG